MDNMRKIILKKAGLWLLVIIAILMATSLLAFYQAVRPPKFTAGLSPDDLGLDYQDITITTHDGLDMKGWFIPASADRQDAPAGTIVGLHGYPAEKGDILPALAPLASDFNLVLFDFRYFGHSQGRYTTLGAEEKQDLITILDYLRDEKDIEEVGVWGFSFGAGVGIIAAAEDDRIRAVYAESSFARLHDLTASLFRLPLIDTALGEMTTLWGRLILGIDSRRISPAESAAGLDIPVIIAHSRDDEVIGFDQAEKLRRALSGNPNAKFVFVDRAEHGRMIVDIEKLRRFFRDNLASSGSLLNVNGLPLIAGITKEVDRDGR